MCYLDQVLPVQTRAYIDRQGSDGCPLCLNGGGSIHKHHPLGYPFSRGLLIVTSETSTYAKFEICCRTKCWCVCRGLLLHAPGWWHAKRRPTTTPPNNVNRRYREWRYLRALHTYGRRYPSSQSQGNQHCFLSCLVRLAPGRKNTSSSFTASSTMQYTLLYVGDPLDYTHIWQFKLTAYSMFCEAYRQLGRRFALSRLTGTWPV